MITNTKKDLVNLRVDFAFKQLFGVEGNEEILISFLNALLQSSLEETITSLHIEDPHLPKQHEDDKLSILDLRATLNNGIKVNIEIQVRDKKDMKERSLYYWSGVYYTQMKKGMSYRDLRQTICINLVDFIMFPEEEDFHNVGVVMNRKSKRVITEDMELHFIEIPKVIKEWRGDRLNPWKDTLVRWLLLFPAHEDERLTTVLEEIAMEKDPVLKRAIQNWEHMSSDESFRRLYEAREKELRDKASEIETAVEKEKKQIILNLYKMDLSLEKIAEAVGLSIEKVKRILKKEQ
ncbi:TPA: Rpn family recombination-promoting nuclease/putative transposase [Bacillus thuringiensis]|nr:Rpn family recombination-promoting nuclease/putative transposase [Bacillus cereus]HDR4798192.1 Rpn family recombination-promoting nuclease/putative transposase [Bacillus cereus]HDR4804280.1 Rpn family recombination-promoting nuclease/putative transposase [Bacillus cereus]HDR4810288.1 Rpn family recombination-promoting nuclease/putative transposase [Bacillus cereus]HDR4833632.1 Rpn family recombination-promoting nuclease/putative transposase [Bacillus cereus]